MFTNNDASQSFDDINNEIEILDKTIEQFLLTKRDYIGNKEDFISKLGHYLKERDIYFKYYLNLLNDISEQQFEDNINKIKIF
jgi:hypothetical protein